MMEQRENMQTKIANKDRMVKRMAQDLFRKLHKFISQFLVQAQEKMINGYDE